MTSSAIHKKHKKAVVSLIFDLTLFRDAWWRCCFKKLEFFYEIARVFKTVYRNHEAVTFELYLESLL